MKTENSITLADWSALPVGSGFPFQRTSAECRVEVACPETAHGALRITVDVQLFSPFINRQHSFWRVCRIVQELVLMLLPPSL